MSRFTWMIFGIVLGFLAAHFANRTTTGQRLFAQVDRGAREFSDAVARGYRTREAEFSTTISNVEQALEDLKHS